MKDDALNSLVGITLSVGFIIGALIGLYFGQFINVERHNINSATNRGFSIGSGVLKQEWHCQPITTHSTIEEAKAKVREYQGNES